PRRHAVDGLHPGGRWPGHERRGGEPDATVAGGQAGARRRARDGGAAHRHAGDLSGRGERRPAARGRRRDPRLSRSGAGSHVVRGRRDQELGPGAGGARRGSGLRGRRDRARGVGRGLAGVGAGGRRVTPAEQARAGLTALAALATRVGEEYAETIAAIADTYVAALRAGGTLVFARAVTVVGFLGHSGGRLKDLTDVVLIVPSDDTARIQEIHLAIEHLICEMVEERLAK